MGYPTGSLLGQGKNNYHRVTVVMGLKTHIIFFFVCQLYIQVRNELLNSVSHTIPGAATRLSLLLRGDSNLLVELNSEIFQHVQKYIIDLGRFELQAH